MSDRDARDAEKDRESNKDAAYVKLAEALNSALANAGVAFPGAHAYTVASAVVDLIEAHK